MSLSIAFTNDRVMYVCRKAIFQRNFEPTPPPPPPKKKKKKKREEEEILAMELRTNSTVGEERMIRLSWV